MRNFTVKSLITLLITSSALLLTPMKSDAQVNMTRLAQVAKSCQEDMFSSNYYKRMGFDTNSINQYLRNSYNQERAITDCISSRYHYSLVMTKYAWLDSTGEILPGYPGSVLVGSLANYFEGIYHTTSILDCIANQNLSSEKCPLVATFIANGTAFRGEWFYHYTVNVCPSCVVAHDELLGSKKEIFKAFVQWFLTLEKTQRRELISLLGDGDEASKLRLAIISESKAAVKKYWEVRQDIQEQEQERRRQEILGN